MCLALTSQCALCDVYGRSEHGRTHENVHSLIPIGSQHQHWHRCPDHTLLWADWMFPRRLFLLHQVDASCFTVNYGAMKGHGGWHHIRVRHLSCRKQSLYYHWPRGSLELKRVASASEWFVMYLYVCVFMCLHVCVRTHTRPVKWDSSVGSS